METVTRFLETFRNDGMVTFNTKATFVLFCFVWMKSLSETNYRTNPNKNFQSFASSFEFISLVCRGDFWTLAFDPNWIITEVSGC